MSTRQQLNDFFLSVQSRAFRQAEYATANREDALDLVQDSMMKLAARYADQQENWPRLFQRILQNAILDWHRRKKVRAILWWFQGEKSAGEDNEPEYELVDKKTTSPEDELLVIESQEKVELAIKRLPLRQQQAFILRAWWELDTREAAEAMSCSEGSIKTHYSRAIKKLAEYLSADLSVCG